MKTSILFPLAFGIFTKISATPLGSDFLSTVGNGAINLASAWTGEAENPQIQETVCFSSYHGLEALEQQSPTANVCGAACDTHCFNPSGGGPNPFDCGVIATNLRNEIPTKGRYIEIGLGSTVQFTYRSCTTFFRNQAMVPLQYCRDDWASLIDYVAFNCQAAQNAHGGLCAAQNPRLSWFVQVNHS